MMSPLKGWTNLFVHSRDRKRSRRSRSRSRGDRPSKRERRDRGGGDDGFRVKDEPRDGYTYNEYGYQVKMERPDNDDGADADPDQQETKPLVDNNGGAAYDQY